MSGIIHSIAPDAGANLQGKLKEHLGITQLHFGLADGSQVKGIIAELGQDYLQIIEDQGQERVIALPALLWFMQPKA